MLADHGDDTFTVKYADGQTEEDVPRACVRAAAATTRRRADRSRNTSQSAKERRTDGGNAGGGDVWLAVERMASELAKRAGVERRDTPLSSLEREKDEVRFGSEPSAPALN